jgi:endonuclease-3
MADDSSNPVAPVASAKRSLAGVRAKPGKGGRTRLSRAEIETLYARLEAQTPEPKGELAYVNPYTLWWP